MYCKSLLIAFLLFHQQIIGQVLINEYSVSNLNNYTDNYQKYEDWIELYNDSNEAIDLSGYYLSDQLSNAQKWQIPEGIVIEAHDFVVFWASGRDEMRSGHYHTNFRLTQTKDEPEQIVLSNPQGVSISSLTLQSTQKGHSRGRAADGGANWHLFTNPSAGSSNNNRTGYLRYAEKPVMSYEAGFYVGAINVSINTDEPDAEIHYTVNGDKPVTSSAVYQDPVSVDETMIIKARVFSENDSVLPGFIEFNTYFNGEQHNLPVISVSSNDIETLLNGDYYIMPFGTFEYFNQQKVRTSSGYGEFNKHGQDSWVHDQRSIDYITRDECGYNYAIREKLLSLSDREEFQRIILRAAGDDNYPGIDTSAHMRDMYVQKLANRLHMSLDVRKAERCVMYANGNYWGIYSIREKVDDHDYTSYYYNQGKYDIEFIMLWGNTWAEYGGETAMNNWYNLYDFIASQDMSDPETYNYVTTQYDITSLVDYVIINSFVVCSDWLNWNVGWWRGRNPDGEHRKWGYILWDEDATFGHYVNYTGIPAQSPLLEPCYPEELDDPFSDPEGHISLLNRLRENPDFRQYYINRYIDLLNTGFQCDSLLPYLDSMAALIAPEIPQHTNRWGGSVNEWENNVEKLRDFIEIRCSIVSQGLVDCYNLEGPYELAVNVNDASYGKVKLNSLNISDYSWKGNYYGGIPVRLEALPEIGFKFDYWEFAEHIIHADSLSELIQLNLLMPDSVTAHFSKRQIVDSLIINEINYNSADDFETEDWVELYNPHDYDLNIGNWIFKDKDDDHIFNIPLNTIIEAHEYLVLCRDKEAFQEFFPHVTNCIGNLDFGFNGAGELLRLFNNEGILIDTVHYDDDDPWPTEPDGEGATLELTDPALDNALASSWRASASHGSPGYATYSKPIESTTQQSWLSIIPNPVTDFATIKVYSDFELKDAYLEIYSIFGEKVWTSNRLTTKSVVFNADNVANGIYVVYFMDHKTRSSVSKKLIISR